MLNLLERLEIEHVDGVLLDESSTRQSDDGDSVDDSSTASDTVCSRLPQAHRRQWRQPLYSDDGGDGNGELLASLPSLATATTEL